MTLCFPVTADLGLRSPARAHFGAAPYFVLVDETSGTTRTVANANANHGSGPCQPLASIEGEGVDVVIVGALGQGAFDKLRARGIRVYLSDAPTVDQALAAYRAGALSEAVTGGDCASHAGAHAHGDHHHHG